MKSVTTKLGIVAFFACTLAACGGGGGGGGGSVPTTPPTATPTPTPTGTRGSTCLVPGTSNARSIASTTASTGETRIPLRTLAGVEKYVPDQVVVVYSTQQLRSLSVSVPSPIEAGTGATVIRDIALSQTSKGVRTLHVDPSQVDATISAIQGRPGVLSVSRVATRKLLSTAPYAINDPYFSQPIPTVTPPGYIQPTAPYFETASIPGQWDMHAISLEYAMGYANAGPFHNALAIGDPRVKIAMIDTGLDTSIKEFSGSKVVYTKCYINGSSSTDVTDFDGHGTNTAGIAAEDTFNSYAFAGTGGNVSLMIYRIFDLSGFASLADEESAVNDAVAQHANVISMSLGGSSFDAGENAVIQNAIAAGVTVVAAAGNDGLGALSFPAGYSNVIAVGATGLVDSQPNGSNKSTTGPPFEAVANYSNWVPSSSTWGLVAPGGDSVLSSGFVPGCPVGSLGDCDDLHWIEGTYATTGRPPCSAGALATDFFGETGNCRVLITGTSQATPHVAGAVALLLSVSPGMSPAAVKAALFASAHNISDPKQGAGRLNVYKLIGTALGDPSTPDQ